VTSILSTQNAECSSKTSKPGRNLLAMYGYTKLKWLYSSLIIALADVLVLMVDLGSACLTCVVDCIVDLASVVILWLS